MLLDTAHKYSLSERLLPKESADGLLVFDPGSLAVHELNSSLTTLAETCDGVNSCEEIVVIFAERYGLSIADASREVYRGLKILRDQGLFDA